MELLLRFFGHDDLQCDVFPLTSHPQLKDTPDSRQILRVVPWRQKGEDVAGTPYATFEDRSEAFEVLFLMCGLFLLHAKLIDAKGTLPDKGGLCIPSSPFTPACQGSDHGPCRVVPRPGQHDCGRSGVGWIYGIGIAGSYPSVARASHISTSGVRAPEEAMVDLMVVRISPGTEVGFDLAKEMCRQEMDADAQELRLFFGPEVVDLANQIHRFLGARRRAQHRGHRSLPGRRCNSPMYEALHSNAVTAVCTILQQAI
mmetsp:Transcript_27557/g.64788  ORF Transcript_27557/g.64788 Transcript_27557/m.64788 type:complete len:257 (-) Transcript_27557:246-1016(-)